MFERLSDGFNGVFRKLSGRGTISESNVREAMDEVRTSLLEADVHLDVVNTFCDRVVEQAIGRDVTKSLKPGQEMIGIVNEELVRLLGGERSDAGEPIEGVDPTPPDAAPEPILRMSPGPTVIMMAGLQGSGKTTTCGKIAAHLKKQGRSTMLVAADLQRPAAVEQLEIVANTVNEEMPGGSQVHFYGELDKCDEYGKAVGVAVQVAKRGVEAARKQGIDTVILDTAGRLHVNDDLMEELHQVDRQLQPHQIFFVLDAMTGQDAVNSARAFHEKLEVDGIILTKFDSDTRGGAAISVKHVTGAPIRFVGTGEKADALEVFHPERMAGRILGMGDVVSLVEKARDQVTDEDAAAMEAKLAKGEMTMDDFLKQLKMLRRMGPMKQLLGLLPGVGSMMKDANIDEKQLDRVEAIAHSMTSHERGDPSVINISRRKRIAGGSGTGPEEVSQLCKQFGMINKLAKSMSNMDASSKMAAVRELQAAGGGDMGGLMPGMPGMPRAKKSTKNTGGKSFKSRKKKRK